MNNTKQYPFTSTSCYSLFQNSRGSALLTAIIIIALISGATIYLAKSITRTTQETASQMAALEANILAQNRVKEALSQLQNGVEPTKIAQKDLTVAQIGSAFRSMFMLRGSAEKGLARKEATYFLSIYGQPSTFLQPSWSTLSLAAGTQDFCSKWISSSPNLKEPVRANSLRTCKGITTDFNRNLFLVGNWEENKEVILTNLAHQRLSWSALGDITFRKKLKLQNCTDLILEIIAAGQLDFQGFEIENTSNIQILLHAGSGALKIKERNESISLCEKGKQETSLRVTLEAARKLTLGSEQYPSQLTIGCSFPREAATWKLVKVVGES